MSQVWKSEWIVITVEPIIDKETFEAAAVSRRERTQLPSKGRGASSELLLSGLVKCGKCGASMVGGGRGRGLVSASSEPATAS